MGGEKSLHSADEREALSGQPSYSTGATHGHAWHTASPSLPAGSLPSPPLKFLSALGTIPLYPGLYHGRQASAAFRCIP